MNERKIIIVGGGTAGWMTALILHHQWKKHNITIELIESEQIGTIGVGEGSTPALKLFFDNLGIAEQEWMPKCNATYKCGITFRGWSTKEGFENYHHPFLSAIDAKFLQQFVLATRKRRQGVDIPAHPDDYFLSPILIQESKAPISNHIGPSQHSYGYHLDATLLGAFLRAQARARKIIIHQDTIVDVQRDEDGSIKTLRAASGRVFSADFYVDCTGFSAILIGDAAENHFVSYDNVLFNDYALAFSLPTDSNFIAPHTTATALSSGWAWDIPLLNRHGCGYVYSSQFISKEQAEFELRKHLSLLESPQEPKFIKMKVGRQRFHWKKNCVAIGLSQGFIEPLEANSLTISQQSAALFATLYEQGGFSSKYQSMFNEQTNRLFDGIRDYIVAHYKINSRTDTDYWQYNRQSVEHLSSSLRRLFVCWNQSSDLIAEIKSQNIANCFPSFSWYCLFAGMGCYPSRKPLRPSTSTMVNRVRTFYTDCAKFYLDHASLLAQYQQ